MAIKRILQLGDPLLVKKSSPVKFPLGEDVRTTVSDLADTLDQFRAEHGYGRGIAAVQIGQLKRMIYISLTSDEFSGVMFNPEIVFRSERVSLVWDDCFSFPDMMVRVKRSEAVTVLYQNQEGKQETIEAAGSFSMLLQHEIDHTNGVLAIHLNLAVDSLMTREEWIRTGRPNQDLKYGLI